MYISRLDLTFEFKSIANGDSPWLISPFGIHQTSKFFKKTICLSLLYFKEKVVETITYNP